jgi:hypothetical protein
MTDIPDDTPLDNETPDNETMREVKRAKARKEAAEDTAKDKGGMGWKTAAGIGIGSAALAAALIYASKARKKDD